MTVPSADIVLAQSKYQPVAQSLCLSNSAALHRIQGTAAEFLDRETLRYGLSERRRADKDPHVLWFQGRAAIMSATQR
jgi:hypothetical protein